MTRICLYTRISTDEENQPTSLASQHERLEAFCKAQEDWRIVARHDDRSTGTKLDRPGLQAALDLARQGRIDQLLVYRIDRLSRKVRQLAQLAEEMDACGVVLRSATEPFDTGSPAGRMMLQMLGVFAEFEHATIVDRITAGIERRAKEGRWYSGRPPFGYTLHDGQLTPDPITAPVVRRIYRLYDEDRLGTIAIAHQLRAEHAPAPSAGWGHPAVHRVLTNPTYLGRIRWRDQDFASEHEPLIDQDTFDRARVILAERGEDPSRRRGNRSDFLLSGVVRCGHCGRAYIGMSARGKGGTYHYYACTARQKYGPKACQGERVSREKLETAVLRQLTGIYRDGPLIHDALGAAQEQALRERPALDEQRRSITAEITRVERSTERYFEAFEQGRLSPERCEQRVARLNARLDDLRAQQAELADDGTDETAHAPTAADLAATADQLEGVIADGEPEQAKALLRILIAELRVNSKTDIQPTYRVLTPDRLLTAGVCATSEKVETAGVEPASAVA
ncbi:MAG TPA: recombinase family protein [Solirubrobacteraceae bacterium]|jgi:site-specific DNA recombinase|nr:recombinase family protein [Solirubrobacteraceae bacterium]